MAEYDDLIKKFSGGVTAPEKETTASPYSDLIAKYSVGTQPNIEAKPEVQQQSNVPRWKTDEEIKASQIPNPEPTIDLRPISKHINQNFSDASALASSGVSDITSQKPFTGIGKAAMGGLGMIAAPFTGIIGAVTEQGEKFTGKPKRADELYLTGNPTGQTFETGSPAKRAELVATSGLPIARVGKAVSAAMPSTRAIDEIVNAIGPNNLSKVIEELKSNPRLSLADVDPNVQIIAQGLAAKPGEPRNLLDTFVKDRQTGKKAAITDAYDEAMGVPVSMKTKVDELKKSIQDTGKEINPIVKASGSVDVTPVVAAIDAQLKPGILSIITAGKPLPGATGIDKELTAFRKLLTDDKSHRTDANSLHLIQSGLRSKAEDLLNSTSGQERHTGRALMDIRNQLVDAIDKVSPQITNVEGKLVGSYRPALSKYRDVNDIDDAFKKGQLITRNKLGQLDDNPEYWAHWIKNATDQELNAAREGARLAVAHQMGSVTNAARKGLDVPQVEFNAEKLKLLFGKEEVTKMMKTLNDERKIADTDSKLFQGTMTAMRLLGEKSTAVRPERKVNYNSLALPVALEAGVQYLGGSEFSALGAMAGAGINAGLNKINKIGQKLDMKTNNEIAKIASTTHDDKQALIKALSEHIPKGQLSMRQKLQLSLPIAP